MKRPLVQPSISKGSALQNLQFNWKICHVVKLKKNIPYYHYHLVMSQLLSNLHKNIILTSCAVQ